MAERGSRDPVIPSSSPLPPATQTQTTYRYNKQLFHTAAFADCTIYTADNRRFQAHRNILSPRCEFFRCCFNGRFEESATRTIYMQDDDPTAVEGMLYYLYTLDYPQEVFRKSLMRAVGGRKNSNESATAGDSGIEDTDEDEDGNTSPASPYSRQDAHVYWGFDLLMFTIADKYGLCELREMATKALLDKADPADQQKQHDGSFETGMAGFVSLIENLYANEPVSAQVKDLRSRFLISTCDLITSHIRERPMSTLMADIPDFAIDLVEVLGVKRAEKGSEQGRKEERHEASRERLAHIPMNDESDCED